MLSCWRAKASERPKAVALEEAFYKLRYPDAPPRGKASSSEPPVSPLQQHGVVPNEYDDDVTGRGVRQSSHPRILVHEYDNNVPEGAGSQQMRADGVANAYDNVLDFDAAAAKVAPSPLQKQQAQAQAQAQAQVDASDANAYVDFSEAEHVFPENVRPNAC